MDGETIFATKQVDLEDQVQEVRLSSELYPWEYSFLVRVNNKESEIGNIYYILVGYLGVLLVVTIFSFVLARMTCLPIVKLMKKLGGKDEDVYYGLERLEQIFLEMQIGKEHMEEMANQYYQIGQNSFLVSLLLGGYDKEYILEYVRKFHTDFAEDMKYLVVIFYFEDMKKQDFFLEEMLKFQIDCMHDKISAMMCNVEAR